MSIVNVKTTAELLSKLSDCYGMVICDDADVIVQMRDTYPSLYVKDYTTGITGLFPNATYVLHVDTYDNSLLLRNVILYEKESTYEEVKEAEEEITEEQTEVEEPEESVTETESCLQEEQDESPEKETGEEVVKSEGEGSELIEFHFDEGEPIITEEELKYSLEENEDREPTKPFEDRDFKTMSSLLAVLTPDMNIVASNDILDALLKERPDIKASAIQRGSIYKTGGMVVLLRTKSRIYKQEARRVYPSDATLFTLSM